MRLRGVAGDTFRAVLAARLIERGVLFMTMKYQSGRRRNVGGMRDGLSDRG